MARFPIACSLAADDAVTRAREWRTFVDHRVAAITRGDGFLRLRLDDGDGTLLLAADLGRREKACCPFLELRLDLEVQAVWLEIRASGEAAAVLDVLVDLCSSTSGEGTQAPAPDAS